MLKQQTVPRVYVVVATTSKVSQQFGLVHVGGFAPAFAVEKVPLSCTPNSSCSAAFPATCEPSMVHSQRPWYPTFERVHVGAWQLGLAPTVLRWTPPSDQ